MKFGSLNASHQPDLSASICGRKDVMSRPTVGMVQRMAMVVATIVGTIPFFGFLDSR